MLTGHCAIPSVILSDRVTTKTTRLDGCIMYRSLGMWLPARDALSHKLNHQQTVSDVEGGDEEEEMDQQHVWVQTAGQCYEVGRMGVEPKISRDSSA